MFSYQMTPIIVIDPGSFTCKIGYSGCQIPKMVFKTEDNFSYSAPEKRHRNYFGPDLEVNAERPIQRGTIRNWDAMCNIWDRIFFELLKVEPKEQDVLMTESVSNTKENREKVAEALFELYGVRSLATPIQPLLSLYASGRLTGVVQECGAEVCQTVPVHHGTVLGSGVAVTHYGGRDVTCHLGRVLAASGFEASEDVLRAVKEEFCCVATSYDRAMRRSELVAAKTCVLPDGRLLNLDEEQFRSPELLFQPRFLGLSDLGVHETLHRSIMSCNSLHRADLYRNIVLSGGCTLLEGFPYRMRNEMCRLADADDNVRIIAPPNINGHRSVESWKLMPNYRKYAVWIGGSLLGSTSAYTRVSVTKEEYEELGPSIVHNRVLWSNVDK